MRFELGVVDLDLQAVRAGVTDPLRGSACLARAMPAVEASQIHRRAAATEAGQGTDVQAWREHGDEELVVRPYQVDRREVALDELALLSIQGQDSRAGNSDDLALEPCVWTMVLQVYRRVPRVPWAELIAP